VAHAALLDSGLPTLGLPDVTLHDYGDLARGRRGLMLVGFAEGLDAAKTYAARDQYDIDANRELIGLGGANLASGLSSGMVVNGSLSKTAVNGSAGAHTQLAGLVVAVLTIVTLLILTGLFESLPEATLAAIVIAAVIELVDVPALTGLYRIYAGPLAPACATGLRRGSRGDAGRADLRHPPRAVHRHRRIDAAPRPSDCCMTRTEAHGCGRSSSRPARPG
jgi:sulfate permease, SulP family